MSKEWIGINTKRARERDFFDGERVERFRVIMSRWWRSWQTIAERGLARDRASDKARREKRALVNGRKA